jgi:hypothetical protein
MSSEQTQAQTASQPASQSPSNTPQEREERLRQLANVFIEMFVASRTELNSPSQLVN